MNSVNNELKKGILPPMCSAGAPRLTFGIYPGGTLASSRMSSGKPNDLAQIKNLVDMLRGDKKPFLMRYYLHYNDSRSGLTSRDTFPEDFLQYSYDSAERFSKICS